MRKAASLLDKSDFLLLFSTHKPLEYNDKKLTIRLGFLPSGIVIDINHWELSKWLTSGDEQQRSTKFHYPFGRQKQPTPVDDDVEKSRNS